MSEQAAAPAAPAAPQAAPTQQQQQSSTPPQGETPAQREARLHRVKVDGNEFEVSEDELRRSYELKKASHKRMQEAAELRKAYETRESYAKQNPAKFLKELGMDAKQWAIDFLTEQFAEEDMDPAQREKKRLERDLEEMRREKETWEEQKRRHEMEREAQSIQQDYDRGLSQAFDRLGIAPTTDLAIAAIDRIDEMLELDYDYSPEQAVEDAIEASITNFEATIAAAPPELIGQIAPVFLQRIADLAPEQLLSLHPGLTEKFHRAILAQARSGRPLPTVTQPAQTGKTGSSNDWMNKGDANGYPRIGNESWEDKQARLGRR